MEYLLAFTLVFSYSIGGIMISNIVYYFILIDSVIRQKGVVFVKQQRISTIIWFFLMILFTLLSVLIYYSTTTSVFTTRSLVQLLFTLQYFVFLINLNLDTKKIGKYILKFSLILSILIIIFYLITGEFRNISNLFGTGRMWGSEFFPGWPNTTHIPMLIGLFLNIKKGNKTINNMIYVTAIFLTTSRGGILGAVLIIIYFNIKKILKIRLKHLLIAILVMTGLAFSSGYLIENLLEIIPSLNIRLFVIHDRESILRVTVELLKNRPLLGYGGNTVDQIVNSINPYLSSHTHNWVLETLLRYGSLGLVFFTGFILSIGSNIREKDHRYMFFLILFLGLFQTYMRNFTILLLMYYIVVDSDRNYLNKE